MITCTNTHTPIIPTDPALSCSRQRLELALERIIESPPGTIQAPLTELGTTWFNLVHQGLNDVHLQRLLGSALRAMAPVLDYSSVTAVESLTDLGGPH